MLETGVGLSRVSSDALRQLLKHVYRTELAVPLTLPELTRFGLQYCASDLMGALRGLDARSIQVLVVCVLAERKAAEERTVIEKQPTST